MVAYPLKSGMPDDPNLLVLIDSDLPLFLLLLPALGQGPYGPFLSSLLPDTVWVCYILVLFCYLSWTDLSYQSFLSLLLSLSTSK